MNIHFILHGKRKINHVHRNFIARCHHDKRLQCSTSYTEFSGHATEIAQETKNCAHVIVVHGGDGLLNEVVNGLCNTAGNNPKVFILPGGTGNDFIRSFDATSLQDPFQIFTTNTSKIPIPYFKTDKEFRYFINIADLGFGGAVVSSLNQFRQRFGPKSSYFLAIVKTFIGYKASEFCVKYNGQTKTQPFFMIAACHGAVFGKGLIIAPGKNPQQAFFQLVVMGRVNLWDYFRQLPKLLRGKRILHPQIEYYETSAIQIETANGISGETDGEWIFGHSIEIGFSDKVIELLH